VTIIEDTRQKNDKHNGKREYLMYAGHDVVRSKLPVGDYALPSAVAVDTKASIDELAANVSVDHERFKRECVAARDMGTALIVLVENALGIRCVADLVRWHNPRAFENRLSGRRPPINGVRLSRACNTMSERYGVRFEFCPPSETGRKIIELLGVDK
jgi:hypothetical protein